MRTFAWLAISGLAWLGLVGGTSLVDVPPQLISLARSLYLGTFSIFLMIDLRRMESQQQRLALQPAELGWYLAPAAAVIGLWLASPKLQLSGRLVLLLSAFYAAQLCLLLIRSSRAGMRSGQWEVAPPALFGLLLTSASVTGFALVFSLAFLAWLLQRRAPTNMQVADSLIMQLPSLCIAPVVLILLRDEFEVSTQLDRGRLEMAGMVINGIGSAAWTTLVMRSQQLISSAMGLWIGAIFLALAAAADTGGDAAILSLLAAELVRGSVWLGLTAVLKRTSRWFGFGTNALATALPLTILLITRHLVAPSSVILYYAVLHAWVPLALWIYMRHRPT